MNIIETVFDFKALSTQQQHYFFEKIYQFDQIIFPNSSLDEFKAFVYAPDAIAVTIIHYHCKGELVGQNVIPILQIQCNNQTMHVVNSRAGFLPEYQKQNLTIQSAVKAMLNRRFKHPFIPLWFVITINQPKIYSLFASRSQNFFPRVGKSTPKEYCEILKIMAARYPEVQKRCNGVYVHETTSPMRNVAQLESLRAHQDVHCNFFLQHAPDYFDGWGIMCICKLDSRTLSETAMNLALNRKVS
ncbi:MULTISPECIES: hypothetical protein [Acinetobacter]|uniref:hypothetical protein n=1 Tax=Acinetobacter TaxID=469 RepID=UPI001443C0FE|nr:MULTISPECIES: hypothetical protein [Acinetobacter]MBF4521505.1 hypothetical protein [Acinetobacter towneri]